MGYLRRLGGMGDSPGKALFRHPVGNGMSLYAALARTGSLPRIFTRFLTAARRAIDARQLYRHERDELLRPGCSHAIAHCPVPRFDKADGTLGRALH